jgi:hypothetical protein
MDDLGYIVNSGFHLAYISFFLCSMNNQVKISLKILKAFVL